VDFPERTFEVVSNPALEAASAATVGSSRRVKWAKKSAAVLVVLLACGIAFRRRLGTAVRQLLAPLQPLHLQPLNPKSGTPEP
jgi:hypothetical protein